MQKQLLFLNNGTSIKHLDFLIRLRAKPVSNTWTACNFNVSKNIYMVFLKALVTSVLSALPYFQRNIRNHWCWFVPAVQSRLKVSPPVPAIMERASLLSPKESSDKKCVKTLERLSPKGRDFMVFLCFFVCYFFFAVFPHKHHFYPDRRGRIEQILAFIY